MSQPNQFDLLRQRRFAPLFWTQFLGAMNDNVFKYAFTLLVTYKGAELSSASSSLLANAIAGLFILPFLLLSATSGQLADKWEKTKIIRFVKGLEIVIMLIGGFGLVFENLWALFTAIVMLGIHSTLFGPVKYGYLPQHLAEHELTGGNGLVETGTFVAILFGTILAGSLIAAGGAGYQIVAACAIIFALSGYGVCRYVPLTPAVAPELKINFNPFSETIKNLQLAKQNRTVFYSILGVSWLWFFGAIFLTQFPAFAKNVIGGNEAVATLLLALFSVGIGVGSMLCEKLSKGIVEIGLVPFGAIGMTVFSVDLFFASHHLAPAHDLTLMAFMVDPVHWRVIMDLLLLSVFAGLYSVPLYALIQSRSPPEFRSRIAAANNIVNAIFLICSAALGAILLGAGLTVPELFLVTGILNACVAIFIFRLVPEFLMRFLSWLLIHTVYRLKVYDAAHIPTNGAAILAANHVSYVDALVISAASPRPIRFVMDHRIFSIPVLSAVFRANRAIPIAGAKENPELKALAFKEIQLALEAGELIGIFPEGMLSSSGEMNDFRPGILQVLDAYPVPVVPLALRGLWGSFFSRASRGRAFKHWKGLFPAIEVTVGPPITPEVFELQRLQAEVLRMRGDMK